MLGLGIFVALAGMACLVLGLRGQAAARAMSERAMRWPTTVATIRAARVEFRGPPTNGYLLPLVEYAYSVGGRELIGSRLCFGYVGTKSRETAEAMLARYPVGANVPVHYDPAGPDNAVLEPDRVTSNYVWLWAGGLVFIVIGMLVAIMAMRH